MLYNEPLDASKLRSLGGFRVVAELGRGAASRLYVVSDPRSGQLHALKHVIVATPRDERYLRQLETEYTIGSRVRHEGVRRAIRMIRYRKLVRTSEAALLLEFVDGVTLDHRRIPGRRKLVRSFRLIAEALGGLHAIGFAHADVKPGNILLTPDGGVRVIDLGQGCRIGTVKTRLQGTPGFLAPEQRARGPITERTDVYNLGATMYRMLTDRTAVGPPGQAATVSPPHDLDPSIHPLLSRQVMHCLRRDPLNRPSMTVVAERLAALEPLLDD